MSMAAGCTGYMVSRMLGAVPVLADSIVEQLCKASDKASESHQHLGAQTEEDAAALSAAVWHSIWPVERYLLPAFHQHVPACSYLHSNNLYSSLII